MTGIIINPDSFTIALKVGGEMRFKTNKAKLNIIPIRRGCGSWECSCGTNHSIPLTVEGKSGSVRIKLIPAPKGIGLCVSDEVKKVMKLAGISDIWCDTRGNTHMRINLIKAVFNALKKLNTYKTKPEFEKRIAVRLSREQREKLDELVKSGKFKNLSDAIRDALDEFFYEDKKELDN